jgi:hypothetical protein
MNENPRCGTAKEAFQQFVFDRCEKGGRELLDNPEYIKMNNEATEVYHKIMNILPLDSQDLLSNYEELESLLEAFSQEYAYRQGLKDGLELRKELGLSD